MIVDGPALPPVRLETVDRLLGTRHPPRAAIGPQVEAIEGLDGVGTIEVHVDPEPLAEPVLGPPVEIGLAADRPVRGGDEGVGEDRLLELPRAIWLTKTWRTAALLARFLS